MVVGGWWLVVGYRSRNSGSLPTTNHQPPTTNHQPPLMPYSRKTTIPVKELIRSLTPITVMGKAMLASVVVWFINWGFAREETLFGSESLKTIADIGAAAGFIPLAYFMIKNASWVARNLLW